MSGRGRLLAGLAVLGIGVAGFVTYSVLSDTNPTTPQAPTEPAACKPPDDDLGSTSIARDERANGASEVTEFVADGEYRVTRCDSDGDLLVSQTVSPIRAPDGDVAVVPTEIERPGSTVSVLYGDPDDPRWAADFEEREAALRGSTIAPTEPSPGSPVAVVPNTSAAAAAGGRSARASDGCTNGQFVRTDSTWKTRSYNYRINRARFNFNPTTIRSIVRGHTTWDATRNSCGLRDITKLTSRHLGSTSATAHLNQPDGQSVTDMGSMAGVQGCSIAIACTIQFPGPNNTAVETDQRFNSRYRFSNTGAAGAYDFQGITTHETGHSIGLGHANSSSALTMFFQALTGTTQARSLGRGDVRGLRARYP